MNTNWQTMIMPPRGFAASPLGRVVASPLRFARGQVLSPAFDAPSAGPILAALALRLDASEQLGAAEREDLVDLFDFGAAPAAAPETKPAVKPGAKPGTTKPGAKHGTTKAAGTAAGSMAGVASVGSGVAPPRPRTLYLPACFGHPIPLVALPPPTAARGGARGREGLGAAWVPSLGPLEPLGPWLQARDDAATLDGKRRINAMVPTLGFYCTAREHTHETHTSSSQTLPELIRSSHVQCDARLPRRTSSSGSGP